MTKADIAPTIGTPEAAVRACVALIASVTGQPEELTERYLDLYYQVRRQADREKAQKDFFLSCDDGTPMLTLIDNVGRPAPTSSAAETPSAAAAPARKKVDFEEVLASASAGAKMPEKPKNAPYGKIKAEIRDRFVALRAQGMTLAQTVNLSGNKVTENQILNIMNGSKVGMDAYNALEDAMNKWEKTIKAADKTDSTA
ncbi:MAG: hypothetical protein IKF98_00575 [Clostridia bacterium]|nr:hypothetical protein [Clostridia bacterium]MBR4549312.1 hypothetical protein [Oscillospiraceae bacterium]